MKIDCEIVQDLIPSYLEELCSDASRRCVEEHIAECEECRSLLLVNLTGIFLILAHTSLLGSLSDFETYLRNFSEITAVMIGISAVSGLVMWGLERRKQFG